jgi:hypothetical protein
MADLDGVPADIREVVPADLAVEVAGRLVTGVGPYAVAANVAKHGIRYGEVVGALLEQDSTRGIVSPFGIARSAVRDCGVKDLDAVRMTDDQREIRDVGEIDALQAQAGGIFD